MSSTGPVPERNNLDLVRVVLASMVFVSHAHDLSGLSALAPLSAAVSSTLAVQAFFVISGFLIFQSYDRSSSLRSYAEKRVRRILPAYLVVVVSSAILLSLLSSLSPQAYFGSSGFWKYLTANVGFLNFVAPELPGVYTHNPVRAVNGALWTLKVEVAFYVAVPVCVWLFRRIGRDVTLSAIFVLSLVYTTACLWLAEARGSGAFIELSRQMPGQMTYFVAGAAIYYHFAAFRARPYLTALIGTVIFLASTIGFGLALRPIGVAIVVMSIAFGPYLGRFGRYGDFSFGIYIVHFPILQSLIAIGAPRLGPLAFLAIAWLSVAIAAFALWHLIEKRFLRRDSHYRRAERVEANEPVHELRASEAG